MKTNNHFLFEDGGEPGKRFVHNKFRNGFETRPVAGSEIKGPRLVATDDTLIHL